MQKEFCIVFTCNKPYLDKFIFTCTSLLQQGQYKGDICLLIGDDLNNTIQQHPFIINNNIIIKYLPNIQFTNSFYTIQKSCFREPHWNHKLFQYHKLHLFNTYFKQWNYILYLDCGIKIFNDINPIINSKKQHKVLAHSDAYPTYNWKLHTQFCKYNIIQNQLTENPFYKQLQTKYNLNEDYFQTTIMLYDTSIINNNTYLDLYQLCNTYPISKTNDQGIISLYFTQIKQLWEQIPIQNNETYFYDYLSRHKDNTYIMLKSY